MNTNLTLPLPQPLVHNKILNNKTYFIHIKKSDVGDLEDLNLIKNLLDDSLSLNSESILLNDFKFINKSDLENKSYKNVGRYLKSNKNSICIECNTTINKQCIFKELNCKHRFHVNCIDSKLKKDLYKKCPKCSSEHVTCLI